MSPLPVKSARQNFEPNLEISSMMETFRQMVNHCIRAGLENDCSTLKRLSSLAYHTLQNYDILSYYKLTAISQACGRLSQMKRDIKKGRKPKSPFVQKPYLVSCYGFKVNGILLSFPVWNREFANILLNDHVTRILSDQSITPRSFTITPKSLSISIAKNVELIKTDKTIGVDRNLRNVTFGNDKKIIQVNTSEMLKIKENYSHVRSTCTRNDHRIRKKVHGKLGKRQTDRIRQRIHRISKSIVSYAKKNKTAIIFEDLNEIRKLYRKGNGQGNRFRRKLNSWSHYELERQTSYKAAWDGVPFYKEDPRCTSTLCPACGGRLQGDRHRYRDLWCGSCRRWRDRDVVAAMNIACKGLHRFCNPQGDTNEAMRGNLKEPAILRVDVSKLVTDWSDTYIA
ncbi:MAG: transposase [Candidatus Nitrosotenuis sp.]|nr:MAG: transposase [Candidatus Nitrosotenuis sp.]